MPGHETSAALSGRRAEAARNNTLILDAAREVFLADPHSPVSTVATRAGVGIGALYRRYPSKQDLLRALAADGLNRYIATLQSALASDLTPWDAYVRCLHEVVEGGSQALAQRLAGTFTPTPALTKLAARATRLATAVFGRVRASGEMRPDVSEGDVVLLLEAIMLIEVPGPAGDALRHRYLALILQALRAPAPDALPGTPARAADLAARWRTRSAADR